MAATLTWSAHAQSAQPDLKRGAALYGQVCVACHAADGNSTTAANPKLAQQHPEYLIKQLQEFKSGKRANAVMVGFATPLSDQDIVNIAAWFSLQPRQYGGSSSADTCERIRPVGEVVIGAAEPIASAPPTAQRAVTPRSGEAVYRAACVACHGAGVAGAPKFGNAADWAPRLAQGTDSLLLHAVQGFRAMPPRGGCADCSDAEIRAAVDYLTATVP
jgi:cytochrome c5